MTGKLIKTAKNTVCQVALGLGICVNDAHSTMIFQSVGVFGEPVFSQIAPIGKPSTAIKVHYFSVPKNHQNTQACHYLKTNLNTLKSGGVIYEIGENGQQTKLTPDLIQQKNSPHSNRYRQSLSQLSLCSLVHKIYINWLSND